MGVRADGAGHRPVDTETRLSYNLGVADLVSRASLSTLGAVGLEAECAGRRRINAGASLSLGRGLADLATGTLDSVVSLFHSRALLCRLTAFLHSEQSVSVPRVQADGLVQTPFKQVAPLPH